MKTPTATFSTTNPLVPALTVAKDYKVPAHLLRGGDQLVFTAAVLGFPARIPQPVYGLLVRRDADGQPYQVLAYLRGGEKPTAYSQREAVRYAAADQEERWFGGFALYFTEVDLTDYADVVKLNRLSDALSDLLCPAGYEVSYAQAA